MTHKIVYTILAVTALSTTANAHSNNAYDYVRFHDVQKNIDVHSMRNAQKGATGRWFIRALYNNVFGELTPAQEQERQIRLQQLQQQKLDKLEEMRVRQIIIDNGAA